MTAETIEGMIAGTMEVRREMTEGMTVVMTVTIDMMTEGMIAETTVRAIGREMTSSNRERMTDVMIEGMTEETIAETTDVMIGRVTGRAMTSLDV